MEFFRPFSAKTLVGKEIPVKVVVDPCGDNKYLETVLTYNAAIKNPFNISSSLKDVFYETRVGGSFVNVSKALEMVDWNNYVVADVADASMGTAEKYKFTQSLYKYYAISDIKWNTDKAKTNIKAVKEGDKTNLVPTAGYSGTTWPDGASFSYDSATNSLVYKNNGATLGKEFVITCPVEVTYKWGVLTANVEITVKPGSGI